MSGPAGEELLEELSRLSEAMVGLEAQIRAAARAARDAGASPSDIARAASVSRPTVYRWTAETPESRSVDVAQTLDAGLLALARHLSTYTADHVLRRRMNNGIDVKIRGWELATKNLPPTMDEETHATLTHTWEVVHAAKSAHDKTGRWPTKVSIGGHPVD